MRLRLGVTESLSETSKVALGKDVLSLDISPQFDAYSGVEIIVTDEITYLAGNRNGRVLSIQNPWGTRAQATAILNALQAKGFQYQPYTAEGAILNPAAEIGDGITVSDTYSGIYSIDRNYSPLMSANVEAPQDEELDHEYPFTPKQDRIYKREINEANAQISLNADAITAEVQNRTTADSNLNTTLTSKINQTASSINATVTQVSDNKLNHTRSNATFGWSLTSSAFKINASGSKNVFTATKDGITIQGNATVTGKIQATSGFIGSSAANGFTITSNAIYNGKTSLTDANNGIYLGKSGIALGANSAFVVNTSGKVTAKNLALSGGSIELKDSNGNLAFRVTSAGDVRANNMTLTGTLTVGGSTITAAALRQGAERANSGYNSWNGTTSTVDANSSYWTGGAGGGYSWNNAKVGGEWATYIKTGTLECNSFNFSSHYCYAGSVSVPNAAHVTVNGVRYNVSFDSYSSYECVRC